ncbi:MAG: Mov34/MPN/PAD-1 family protein [Nitrososphaerales archaeon]
MSELFEKEELWSHYKQTLGCFIYQGKIAVMPEVDRKIKERIKLWSRSPQPTEWACVLTGKISAEGGEGIPLVTDFYELPAWNLGSGQHAYTICLDDIAKIAEKNFVLALLHSHPSGNIFPSSGDVATFLYTDLLLGRPIFYIITSPSGEKLILSFVKCWSCEHSFFRLIKEMGKPKGGEKVWGASM